MNVLSSAVPWDIVADGYSASAMGLFEQYSAAALELVPVGKHDTVADIACGPGTLALQAAVTGADVAAVDFSVKMLAHLEDSVSDMGLGNVSAYHGDGQQLQFEDETFDAAFSMFALMFYPDRQSGFRELHRIIKQGSAACVATFASPEQSPLLRQLFGVISKIDPAQAKPSYNLETLEDPKVLAREMKNAGFSNVVIHPVVREIEFASAEEFVTTMAEGSAPMQLLRIRLSEEEWQARINDAIDHVKRDAGPFPRALGATALLAVGVK